MNKKLIIFLVAFVSYICIAQVSKAQVKFGASIGFGFPMGAFTEENREEVFPAANSGFGIEGDLKILLSPHFSLGIDLGYAAFGTDPLVFPRIAFDEVSIRMIAIRAGAEYIGSEGPVQPYVGGGLGIYTASMGGRDVFNGEKKTNVGVHFGGGLLFRLAKDINLNTALKFNIAGDVSYVDLRFGMMFNIHGSDKPKPKQNQPLNN